MSRSKLLAAALALALVSPLAFTAEPVMDAGNAVQRITAQGYSAPYKLKFQNGYWTAKATSREGMRVSLLVDPASGQVSAFDRYGSGAIDANRVRELVLAAGYTRVHDIDFDDGFWEVEAIDSLGREIDLILHPITGAILNAPLDPPGSTPLSRDEIHAHLVAAGYSNIHELDFDDRQWEADATNAQGQRVEVRIDPYSGDVVRESIDD
ncbi:MAG TPA: PepSY domain-containing protein [Chiayiivirga sp.]|nr:PepSY domain-containing protein [Chiayiivirga sp.]